MRTADLHDWVLGARAFVRPTQQIPGEVELPTEASAFGRVRTAVVPGQTPVVSGSSTVLILGRGVTWSIDIESGETREPERRSFCPVWVYWN